MLALAIPTVYLSSDALPFTQGAFTHVMDLEGMSKEDVIAQIEPYLKTEPGLAYNFTQPIAMRVDELTSGVKSDLAVKIYGEDLDQLNKIGENISALVSGMNGTANFFVEQPIGQPYLTIEIDRAALASFGLNVNDVQAVIASNDGEGQDVPGGQRRRQRPDRVIRYRGVQRW